MDMLINYYSDWHRLNKAIAYYIRLRRILVNRLHQRQLGSQSTSTTVVGATPLTVNELDEAEHCILKYVQSQAFQSEREVLKQRNSNISGQRGRALKRTGVPRTSSIYRLDPFLENSIIRVGGRLSKSVLPEDMKHPVVLPRRSHVTKLIIKHVHEQLAHAGRNHVLATLREKYWIINGNTAVRHMLTS
jgi:hypothetical protein